MKKERKKKTATRKPLVKSKMPIAISRKEEGEKKKREERRKKKNYGKWG